MQYIGEYIMYRNEELSHEVSILLHCFFFSEFYSTIKVSGFFGIQRVSGSSHLGIVFYNRKNLHAKLLPMKIKY